MTANSTTDAEIMALEKSYWDAIKAKDGDTTARLSGDPSLVGGASGIRRIARDKMAEMTRSTDWELRDYRIGDVEILRPRDDLAIVAYKVTESVTVKGRDRTYEAAELSTWVRGDRGWECLAHSETVLDGG